MVYRKSEKQHRKHQITSCRRAAATICPRPGMQRKRASRPGSTGGGLIGLWPPRVPLAPRISGALGAKLQKIKPLSY